MSANYDRLYGAMAESLRDQCNRLLPKGASVVEVGVLRSALAFVDGVYVAAIDSILEGAPNAIDLGMADTLLTSSLEESRANGYAALRKEIAERLKMKGEQEP